MYDINTLFYVLFFTLPLLVAALYTSYVLQDKVFYHFLSFQSFLALVLAVGFNGLFYIPLVYEVEIFNPIFGHVIGMSAMFVTGSAAMIIFPEVFQSSSGQGRPRSSEAAVRRGGWRLMLSLFFLFVILICEHT